VLFICENNLHAATTPASITFPCPDIAPRAAGFAMPALIVDGQDAVAVYEVAKEAVSRARRGEGPSFIEAKTYRFQGHCGAVAEHACPEECALWQGRDPIELLRRRMLESGANVAELDAVSEAVLAELDEAERFAVSSPFPEPAAVEQFVM